MNHPQDLTQYTANLTQAVGILQGVRWDATESEARQFLISMDMDLAFAAGLVADMEADGFMPKMHLILRGEYVTTGYKSIAIWVRKFGFDATLNDTGEAWVITYGFGSTHTDTVWPPHAAHGLRNMSRGGCAGIAALVVAAAVFIGIWVFTGDIWAAIFLFEIIFDILMEIADIF